MKRKVTEILEEKGKCYNIFFFNESREEELSNEDTDTIDSLYNTNTNTTNVLPLMFTELNILICLLRDYPNKNGMGEIIKKS